MFAENAQKTCNPEAARRHAAGEDPAKRDQILKGALRVFLESGFDAASMNDIRAAAGVSKSTLYVYFSSKEELFVAMIEGERDRLFADVDQILDRDLSIPEKLTRYGLRLAEIICSDQVIKAQRIIIGTAERMPDLGARFYQGGAQRAQRGLSRFLDREVAAGRLAIPDTRLAAYQFVDLTTSGIWRPRLFGAMTAPPPREALEANVAAAVRVFLAAYVGAAGA
ncbi:TetR/AcrR family transcriptional regulator [Oceaniglobus roseus]|uniref:TetR/AcrR family transcriptional regulator n=1 Tax=Oceaniglobus roseus TaxID=1737570 RepID=UPI001FE81087|nr:TetR/AcrR family transcriptional regulator [Kandeliimicrobium roseum]